MKRVGACGFSLLELAVALGLAAVLLALAFTGWRGYTAKQRLRYGTVQVATDLRQAQERAKAERATYTVTFAGGSSAYLIARSGGGFVENAALPSGVTVTAAQTVTFDAFGRPVDAMGQPTAYTVVVQNSTGSGSVSVNPAGGISYQAP
ncbi:MAG: prepilin-type N-terminal cleavage/methylation domain-containing protein [Armatimonadota bacterium]|nr:prepilin-type N-terminal cleavage/methylation domain-containing protein [Armatimonadota bacterium]MDR7428142.1 prepilin-type N-terminal cleavage/methylation domain-containing protein [Armatimonadota bacterium]MDR7463710.1 prepilin-type N-terminal cleavage/methylation domain-containing protein [Armatimonadota bacterium]MDR7470197.1 prepilin-type N-terminal cleavage/methylation domain-containing protein [Armatimonadota bacterium]MDR7473625.1 prepilin-type N-terminal cleavage/methylation domain